MRGFLTLIGGWLIGVGMAMLFNAGTVMFSSTGVWGAILAGLGASALLVSGRKPDGTVSGTQIIRLGLTVSILCAVALFASRYYNP